jgi:hypothetical protein
MRLPARTQPCAAAVAGCVTLDHLDAGATDRLATAAERLDTGITAAAAEAGVDAYGQNRGIDARLAVDNAGSFAATAPPNVAVERAGVSHVPGRVRCRVMASRVAPAAATADGKPTADHLAEQRQVQVEFEGAVLAARPVAQ